MLDYGSEPVLTVSNLDVACLFKYITAALFARKDGQELRAKATSFSRSISGGCWLPEAPVDCCPTAVLIQLIAIPATSAMRQSTFEIAEAPFAAKAWRMFVLFLTKFPPAILTFEWPSGRHLSSRSQQKCAYELRSNVGGRPRKYL